MLTLTFLGIGSAFARRNFQSNALVEAWTAGPDRQPAPDDTLLVDFGGTGPMALHQLTSRPEFRYLARNGRIYYPAIRRIFITHLHGDHIGGLEEIAAVNTHQYRDPATGRGFRPQLISEPALLAALWENSLKGALGVLLGRPATLADYFTPHPVYPSGCGKPDSFTLLERYRIRIFPTDHIRLQHKHDWPSYGLLIDDPSTGRSVMYSGDTRFDPASTQAMMSEAAMIFHEVQLDDVPEPIHALLRELRTLPEPIRRKMLLYHVADDWDAPAYRFVADEFAGFVRPQHRYTIFP